MLAPQPTDATTAAASMNTPSIGALNRGVAVGTIRSDVDIAVGSSPSCDRKVGRARPPGSPTSTPSSTRCSIGCRARPRIGAVRCEDSCGSCARPGESWRSGDRGRRTASSRLCTPTTRGVVGRHTSDPSRRVTTRSARDPRLRDPADARELRQRRSRGYASTTSTGHPSSCTFADRRPAFRRSCPVAGRREHWRRTCVAGVRDARPCAPCS